jgi:cell division protein ZapA
MPENKNILNTTILHEDFTLSSDQPLEKLETIVKYVDGKMNEIYARLPMASYKKIAVLAALNIAEELFLMKDQAGADNPELLARTEEIISRIDSVL